MMVSEFSALCNVIPTIVPVIYSHQLKLIISDLFANAVYKGTTERLKIGHILAAIILDTSIQSFLK